MHLDLIQPAKQIVLFTKSHLLASSIRDNLPNKKIISAHKNSISIVNDKIDLLILDSPFSKDLQNFNLRKIKITVNLGGINKFLANEIKLPKPFKLISLLNIIEDVNNSSRVFCIINNDFVYDEDLRTLNSAEKKIKLTEKENEIFKAILVTPNYQMQKNLFLKNIWRYHQNTESSTVNTHLYKLKNKLPRGMLQLKNNICKLDIKTLI